MLKPITVQRATVANGMLEPVQCSQNLQLAINNSDHLTVIEPRLPLLHQAVSSVSVDGKQQNFLDQNALYDVREIFHVNDLVALGLQIFSRVLIEDQESGFNFTRLTDPIIVGHKWSPLDETTRDCYLGVLLNTGEVLVLKRDSLDASAYKVHFRSFTCLIDQMNLELERLTSEGDIILRNEQFLELKVNSFEFNMLPNGQLVITLAHESGEISIHKLEENLPLIERFQAGGLVVKQAWSELTNNLFYALNDNSVHMVPIDDKGRLRSPPITIKESSRFTISQLKCSKAGNFTAIVDTCAIYLVDGDTLLGKQKLPYRSIVTSLPFIETALRTSILVFYEAGQLCLVHCADGKMSVNDAPSTWKNFTSRTLYKYQLLMAKEKEKLPSKTFRNFLAETPEANICNYGTQLTNGMLVTVHSLSPRNTIHYDIKSQMEFTVSLIPAKEIDPNYEVAPNMWSTSLCTLNMLFLHEFSKLPAMSSDVVRGDADATKAFISAITEWKLKSFIDPSATTLDVEPFISLEEGLILNFRNNTIITKLQTLFTMNESILRTLNALNSKVSEVNEHIIDIAQEQDKISLIIRQHLSRIFMQYLVGQSSTRFPDDIDKFMLLNYYIILRIAGIDTNNDKIQNAKITVSTDICTESFEVNKDDKIPDDFLKYLKSTSDHKWARCDLTLVPLLELEARSDELELHNYSKHQDLDSELFSAIFNTLGYCVYSGNRLFNTTVGM